MGPTLISHLVQKGRVGDVLHHVRVSLQPGDIGCLSQGRIILVVIFHRVLAHKYIGTALIGALVIVIPVRLVVHKGL